MRLRYLTCDVQPESQAVFAVAFVSVSRTTLKRIKDAIQHRRVDSRTAVSDLEPDLGIGRREDHANGRI